MILHDRMRPFLVVFIVCLGLSSGVHPENEVKANPSEIQESFHSFFNSLGSNNEPQTKIYRSLLEREAVKERQAFDLAKEELQETRKRYTRNKRNPPQSGGEIRAKAVVFKREATENKDETGAQSETKNEYATTRSATFAYYSDPKEELRVLRAEVNYYRDLQKKLKYMMRSSEELFNELSNTLRELMDAVENSSPPDLAHNHDGLFYEGEACVEKIWRFHDEMVKLVA